MKINYTREEACNYIAYAREVFDFVRVVNPGKSMVCSDNGDDTKESCHSFWNRRERCENCTSNRALQTKGRAIKYETIGNQSYLVISKYFEIDEVGNVIEMIANITDDFTIELDKSDKMAPIIDSLNRQLMLDPLTKVYNRRFLDSNFVPSLNCCLDLATTVNVAIMDIDDFKIINDTFGHMSGDMLLKDIASFWQLHFNSRENNKERLVVRIGGDEFLVIGCGLSGDNFRNLIDKYYSEMRKTCYYDCDKEFHFNVSIGYSSSDDLMEGWSWEQLLSLADKDMYAKKSVKE